MAPGPHTEWIEADDPSSTVSGSHRIWRSLSRDAQDDEVCRVGLIFTLMAIFSSGCAARSVVALRNAPASDDWSAVTRLATGTSLRVEVSAEPSTTGRLVSVQANQVTISSGSWQRTFLRPEIRRVVLVQRRTGEKAKRGLVIGAIAGALVGGLTTESNQGSWAAVMAAGWGAIGAVIGASDGFFDREETLVYLASDVTAAAKGLANPPLQPTSGIGSRPGLDHCAERAAVQRKGRIAAAPIKEPTMRINASAATRDAEPTARHPRSQERSG